uniref:hypothetical protein n=1 Tax=Methylobacterium sp. B34 TaxID=95563 RepID=UPI0003453FB0|nr:hypothetical protein [Methylobacterium sp. B34]
MIIRHTRRLQRSGEAVASRDGRLVAPAPTEPDWDVLGLIDLGGRVTVVALLGPNDARAFRFLNPDGTPLASCAADFLAAPWDGAGPLDWQAEALHTDDGDASNTRAMIEDLHLLIEALARAAAASPEHAVRVVTGGGSDPRAQAMHAALARLNAAPAGAPPHLPELVTKAIVARGGQETAHPDGGDLRFPIYLPMPGFRFVGYAADRNETLCTLIGKNSRLASALLDVRANTAYARPNLGSVGFDAATLVQVRLWRQYLLPALIDGAARSTRVGVVFEHAHISHAIWNELAAVDDVLSLGRAPAVFLFASCNEPISPVDAVFPELAGQVYRGIEGPLPLLQAAVAGAATFLPFRSYRVSQRLADRLAALARSAEPALDARLTDAARRATIVLIGLRLENRQWVRQLDGYVALIRRLGRRRGERFLVIVDGHNTLAGAEGGYVESYCESLVPAEGSVPSIVRKELELIGALRARVADVSNVELMPLVPCSMGASLVAALHTDLFVTHFGAGLAKYKWVANAPGCVISSRSVLSGKDDLRIYDTEIFRENVSACHYFPAERVTDLDTSTNALHVPGSREREDFDLDLEEFASFVEQNLPKRRAARPHWLRRLTLFRTRAATDAARL